jgi:hypothetical protein
VHLNPKFLKLSGQKSLEPSVVVPYLKNNLHWGVQKASVNFVLILHDKLSLLFHLCSGDRYGR